MAECHLCHSHLSACRLLPSNWRIFDTRHSLVLRVCYMSLDWVNICIDLEYCTDDKKQSLPTYCKQNSSSNAHSPY